MANRVVTSEEILAARNEKIHSIENLYSLIFETKKCELLNLNQFKLNLNLSWDDKVLMQAVKMVKRQVELFNHLSQDFPNNEELKDITSALKVVVADIVKILKNDFRMARNLYRNIEIIIN